MPNQSHQQKLQTMMLRQQKLIYPLSHRQSGGFVMSFIAVVLIIGSLLVFSVYLIYQDRVITSKFESKRWNIPAKVYSKPLELYQGAQLRPQDLENWLSLLNYTPTQDFQQKGTYQKQGLQYTIHTRAFNYHQSDSEPSQVVKFHLKDNRIENIQSTQPNISGIARLEPVLIGGIYPDNNEDRIVLHLSDIPQPLIDALVATEDRDFFEHHGVSVRSISRAIVNNVTGGQLQGGSTITQQLIKNFYLTSERTLKRKANEAVMAVLLELHYSKKEILQTYMNEIYLGQNGNHSINGFGLASQFYFNRPLNELRIDQQAMLVGIARGPTLYNPFRYPEKALERRNTVLHNMLVMGKLSQEDYNIAITQPLDVVQTPALGKSKFPDFLDIVKRELNKTYYPEDLKNEGLRIFTTLDPNIQMSADNAVNYMLPQLRKSNQRLYNLQSALVSANPRTGELVAVVGSGDSFTGFNRVVDAKRQVGSLLKPIIYLMALNKGEYNLATGISDDPITVNVALGEAWTPKNYDFTSHGVVPLTTALAQSYNQSAVRLGIDIGIPQFNRQLQRMGIEKKLPTYPSILLGAVLLSPMDMLNVYQVLASGGEKRHLHTIRAVVDSHGRLLPNHLPKPTQAIEPAEAFLTNYAMQQVVKQGTAKSALVLGESLNLAGKTGTTNDYRDAWFAGYSGNYVSVVWVGRDDNQPIQLSGGSGALPIWIDYMKRLQLTPVQLTQPTNVNWFWLENGTGKLSHESCENSAYLPVNVSHTLPEDSECLQNLRQQQQAQALAQRQAEEKALLEQRRQQRMQQIEQNRQSQSTQPTLEEPAVNVGEEKLLTPEPRSERWLEQTTNNWFN